MLILLITQIPFQSTPPSLAETIQFLIYFGLIFISIHSAIASGDLCSLYGADQVKISIHSAIASGDTFRAGIPLVITDFNPLRHR